MFGDDTLDDLPVGKLYDGRTLRRLVPIVLPFRRQVASAGLLLLASSALSVLPPLLVRRAIDVDITGGDFHGLLRTVGAFVLLQLAIVATGYVLMVALESLGVRMVSRLKETLFGHMLDLDAAYFDRSAVGQLIARVEGDTEAIRRLFTSTMFTLLGSMVSLVGVVGVMIAVSPRLFAAVATILPMLVLVTIVYQRKVRPLFAQVRRKYAAMVAFLTEMLQGMRVVQAFSRERQMGRRAHELSVSMMRSALPADVFSMGFFSLMGVFEIVGLAIILAVGGRLVALDQLSIGYLVMFLGYLRQLFQPVYAFSEQVSVMQRAFAAADRVFEVLDMEPEVGDPPTALPWPSFRVAIEFRDVSFAYAPRNGNAAPEWVLRNVSFTVRRGEKVALVGATGGGKTSVINLMLRFYDPQEGAVLVDGRDIREIATADLRRRFGLVLQDVFLFPGTVRENLTLGADIPEDRLAEAVEVLGLDRALRRLPLGLASELSERGSNLSQGERQLVSLARALVFDPEVLILDEATSSVDPHSERLIQAGIQRLLAGRTAIIIAHRLSTVLDADRILVVHRGRIVESGTHEELLAQQGYYARLYHVQFADRGAESSRRLLELQEA